MATKFLGLRFAAALALGGTLAGCGGGELPPVDLVASDDVEAETDFGVLARFSGTLRDGRLLLREIPSADLGPVAQGFGEFTSGLVSFDTLLGDGVGTGTCTNTQYCGTVQVTNATGVLMDNLWVEITDTMAIPAGAIVTWGGAPFNQSDTYRNFFINSTSPQAASYGNFAIGQTKSLEWKFNINAGSTPATYFDFTATVYASFRRTGSSGSVQKKRPAVNACAISGSTNWLQGTDDAEINLALPFPFTMYDITYDRAVIGSNGYFLPYRTGSAAPTAPVTNLSTASTATPIGQYVFWDDLAYDGSDGVCTATSGTKPNRTFTVTWRNAKINANQPAKGTWTTDKVTYSLILQETVDTVSFHYNLPTGSITNLTRGISATTGSRVVKNGSGIGSNNSFNAVSAYIPALAADYGGRIVKTATPSNP